MKTTDIVRDCTVHVVQLPGLRVKHRFKRRVIIIEGQGGRYNLQLHKAHLQAQYYYYYYYYIIVAYNVLRRPLIITGTAI